MMSSTSLRDTKAVRFLSGTASTFGISGAFMLAANLSSPTCAYYLPRTLYMIGFCTGVLHAFHGAYASYKIYIQKRDSGWF
ncbi:hypothetical protein HPB50_019763 [Hyalomma asiaticum]|uniref:Uncharacterized protein n=1 Tax=Hyalomma asiaticum TaxID=266040 RepID=A0ACB7RY12_HYAAI|nr:hypothetical protein HPB50_019763 [Hyalomma asiaticum]